MNNVLDLVDQAVFDFERATGPWHAEWETVADLLRRAAAALAPAGGGIEFADLGAGRGDHAAAVATVGPSLKGGERGLG